MNTVWKKEDKENIEKYEKLLGEHGLTFRALDWGSRESQLLRFKILAEIGFIDGDSVLDVGCGLGDLYAWLQDHKYNVEYEGIDITPPLVQEAAKLFPQGKFSTVNIMDDEISADEYDYIVASGIFSKRPEGGQDYVFAMIERMYSLARKGLAFNLLSLLAPNLDEDDFAVLPENMLKFCQTITPRVVLRHDYHPNDMTLYLYKDLQK